MVARSLAPVAETRWCADQADLVTVEHTLHQVLNYKGL